MSGFRLIVAEKPSVARDIARVLGVRGRGTGVIGDGETRISWCLGHLAELAEPASYDPEWKAWRLDALPMLPEAFKLTPRKDSKDQWKVLSGLMRDKALGEVINACDAGREGELIFAQAYQLAGCKAPVRRLWISAMTDEAIKGGFRALRAGDSMTPLEDAARCRSEADWLVGLNATRAMTLRLRRPGDALLLSLGRVQTPTLAMLTKREDEIEHFEPQPFWQLKATFEVPAGTWEATWCKVLAKGKRHDRFEDKAEAEALLAKVKDKDGEVVRAEGKRSREKPPLLYDLTALQKEANARFGFSAKRTLDIAQSLYERKKVLTYPRTDSRHLSGELVETLPERLRGLVFGPYEATAKGILERWPVELGKRVVDDGEVSDHHAIVPTGVDARSAGLEPDEKKVFDLVARRFLAVFEPDAVFAVMEIDTEILGELFAARGRALVEPGWRAIDPPRSKKKEAPLLPAAQKGETAAQRALALHEGKTKPPPRYSEATLLGAMERAGEGLDDAELKRAMKKNGLGTPATRAAIIETLLSRGYAERDKTHIVPTDQGRALVRALPVESLRSPALTGTWEARLVAIAEGRESRATFMDDIRSFTREAIETIKTATIEGEHAAALARPGGAAAGELLGACPLCGSEVHGGERGWRCASCDLYIPPSVAKRAVSPRLAKQLLTERRTKAIKGFKAKTGKSFAAALVLEDDGHVGFHFPEPDPLGECPACGETVRRRGSVYTCAKGRDCPFVVFGEMQGRAIEEDAVRRLLVDGKSALLEGFKDREGREYAGRLVVADGRVRVARSDPRAEAGHVGACPRCGKPVAFESGKWRCPGGDLTLPAKVASRKLEHAEVAQLLADGRTPRLHGFRQKSGAVFKAALVLALEGDPERPITFDFDAKAQEEPLPPGAPPPAFGKRITCPVCNHRADPHPGYVIAGREAWGCSKWKEGCKLRVPFVVEGQRLNDEDASKLLGKQRKTRLLRGLHNERGNLPVSRVVLRPGEEPCWVLERS